jgi:predicted transglutaminase-like cysteine proteinase
MGFRSALIAGAVAALCVASVGSAFSAAAKYLTPEYGSTLPPVGFVKFCTVNPADCKSNSNVRDRISMSPELWNKLYLINSYVNGKIAPISDQDLYGEAEHWAYPTDAGDCEDYVLLKKRSLEVLGFSEGALLITVVLDEKGEGHAVLTVATDVGDYVLDNRVNDIVRWSDTHYKFLKRQSHNNPMQWIALVKQATSTSGNVASGN